MHRPIQLTQTTSSRRTSQVTRPDDNKAIGTRFHALIAGLRPAVLILARRIAFPLLLLIAGLMLVQPCAGQSGTWTATGSLITARFYHTATLLPNGKVLVAGGGVDRTISRARNFTIRRTGPGRRPAASPPHASDRTATLLPNGKVLVAGGLSGVRLLHDSELYDPASGTWTATGSLINARNLITRRRCCPTARCLSQEASVSATDLDSAELYDPATGTWTANGQP